MTLFLQLKFIKKKITTGENTSRAKDKNCDCYEVQQNF